MSLARAAVAVLFRSAGATRVEEVFLVERAAELRGWGGEWSFPGGKLEEGDSELPFAGHGGARADVQLAAAELRATGTAARELFEETGILIASAKSGVARLASALEGLRERLVAGGTAAELGRELRDRGLEIEPSRFLPACRLITPAFLALRIDADFFLVRAEADTPEPAIWPGELVRGRWLEPRRALDLWRRRELRIAPPAISILEVLAERELTDALAELRRWPPEFEGSGRAVAWSPGYELLPLTGRSLPPVTPTNTILLGAERFVVIDPGAESAAARHHIELAVERRLARGDRLEAVVLTHHHPDHIGGLDTALERFGAPLWAHPLTAARIERSIDRALGDGDTIELGTDPAGVPHWGVRVLFTPGHAEGHIALYDARFRTLIAGDLVSTLVSMYVGSPGGNVREYLDSLETIGSLEVDFLVPAHGAPTSDPRGLIDRTIAHRRRRIEEVASHLGDDPRSVADIAFEIYPQARGASGIVEELVIRTTRAALEWLGEHERARGAGPDLWARIPEGLEE